MEQRGTPLNEALQKRLSSVGQTLLFAWKSANVIHWIENPAGAPELPAVTVMVIETGVWVPQLSVGASNAGLGVGCGFAPAVATRGPANASVLMAINAASVVILFIILLFVCFILVVIAGRPLWQSRRNRLWIWSSTSHLLLRELPGEVLERSQAVQQLGSVLQVKRQ